MALFSAPPMVRGIYGASEERDPELRGRVPTFDTAAEREAWESSHTRCTNPAFSQCAQIFTHACDWAQVQALILGPLARYREAYPLTSPPPLRGAPPAGNAFAGEPSVLAALTARLDLPIHAATCEESTLNTLRYLFFHMRHGIFVLIRRNALLMFAPFVNKDFENGWGAALEVEGGDVGAYLEGKREALRELGKHRMAREEVFIEDRRRWWANGNIMCNVASPNFWNDSYLPQLKHLLLTLCARRRVPDCEFFINKRDFPQLKRNRTEPYDFLFAADDEPLAREAYATYAPVASFFVGAAFADLPLVCTDDWETATGLVFPCGHDLRSAKNRREHAVPWAERVATAIFRGGSTGPGTRPENNQRIRLAQLAQEWARPGSPYGVGNGVDGAPFLDAGLVGWNLRDRKLQGQPMTYIKPAELDIQLKEKVPMYKQMRYKYQLYVEGHCAAMRYASMMPLGSLIMKVVSTTKADSMWYFPLLAPFDWKAAGGGGGGGGGAVHGDHIEIAADFSDLAAAIAWAKTHDAVCAAIAGNAQTLYERLIAVDGQLDYMQLLCSEVAARFRPGGAAVTGGGGSGGDASGAAGAATLLPEVCAPPRPGGDWFGAGSDSYAGVGLGVDGASGASPPHLPAFASRDCACPTCEAKRHAAAAEAERARAAKSAALAAAESGRAAAGGRSGGGGGGGGGSSSGSAAAAAAQKPQIFGGGEFKNLVAARAAAARAAAQAATIAAAAAAAAAQKRARET